MILFAALLLILALFFFFLGAAVFQGRVRLIPARQRKHVEDIFSYCRELGANIFYFGVFLLCSALFAFLPPDHHPLPLSMFTLLLGVFLTLFRFLKIQCRYNGSVL